MSEFRTLIPIVAAGIILIGFLARRQRSKKLERVGVSATAEILEVKETGMYDNHYNLQIN